MSQAMLETLREMMTIDVEPSQFPRMTVASNTHVHILGTVKVKVGSKLGATNVMFHVVGQASHPLILGIRTPFLSKKNVILDFRNDSIEVSKSKIRARKQVHVPPNSESIIWAKVSRDVRMGTQGLCNASRDMNRQNVLVAHAVVTVGDRSTVPVRIMNPTNQPAVLGKNLVLADFKALGLSYAITLTDLKAATNPTSCHVHATPTSLVSGRADNVDGNLINRSFQVSESYCATKPDIR